MMKPLSPTQLQILTSASQHPARLADAPPYLPMAARNAVFQSLIRAGLLEEVSGEVGTQHRITETGLVALGAPVASEAGGDTVLGAPAGTAGQPASAAASQGCEAPVGPPAAQPRASLRDAATALLVAWDAGVERSALPVSVEALRAALTRGTAPRPPRDPSAPGIPRKGTKHQAVLSLLRRAEGATIAQIMAATSWAQHTVRGFLAGLKKKGHTVQVMERVRQVGPGAQGAKGSYSVYRIGGEQG